MNKSSETPPELGGRKYDRFITIWRWLCDVGVCRMCGVGIALAQVERELGDPTFRATKGLGCKNAPRVDCFDLARSKWPELPKG